MGRIKLGCTWVSSATWSWSSGTNCVAPGYPAPLGAGAVEQIVLHLGIQRHLELEQWDMELR